MSGDDLSAALGACLTDLVDSGTLPGASVLVLKDGAEVCYAEAGWQDLDSRRPIGRDTVFRIYSMTKPVTAAVVMSLVEEGRLGLQDRIGDRVPELASLTVHGADPAIPVNPVTVEQLLTHTAGFSYPFQPGTPVAALYAQAGLSGDLWRFDPAFAGGGALARRLAEIPLAHPPGTRFHYGMGLDVAALVAQRAAGLGFDELVSRRITEPLGMVDTGFWLAPEKGERLASLYAGPPGVDLVRTDDGRTSPLLKPLPGFSGGGGLLSTIDDYAAFVRMLLRRGEGDDGRRILLETSVREMMTNRLSADQLIELPQLAAFGLGGRGEGLGIGYGGAVTLDPAAQGGLGSVGEYAWGGAASTTFWLDPARDLAVIFMTQVIPPGRAMIRDRLRAIVYASMD